MVLYMILEDDFVYLLTASIKGNINLVGHILKNQYDHNHCKQRGGKNTEGKKQMCERG